MAEYDGSIRIGVSVDSENAKKQLENLRNRMVSQTKEIDKQTAELQKLEAQYKKLTDPNIEPEGLQKLENALKKVQQEAAKLDTEYQALRQMADMDVSANGVVSPEISSRLQEVTARLSETDARADALNKQLEKLRMPPETTEEAKKLAEQIAAGKERLAGMQEESAKTAAEIKRLESWPAQLAQRIGDISARIKGLFTKNVNRASKSTKTLHSRISKVGQNRGFDKAGKSAGKLGNSLKRIGKRILNLAASALIFNVLSKAFTELTKRVGEYLNVNKQFTSSLATIKGNLLTAFQPIYENIMPALNELMGVLQQASAVLAKFMAQLFGTTAEKAQANAKALHDQAKAAEEVADETKKAEKSLASFDTIEILGKKEDKEDEKEAAFDQDYSDVEVPKWLETLKNELKELMDILSGFFKPLKDAWDQYGPAVMDALKSALSAVWELIKAIARTFMEIWNSPLIQETLALIASLFTNILGIIKAIADTFRKVWEDGEGKKLLENLTLLFNTILGIINDIAVAFRAAWDNYGEEVVRALFFMINSVLELLITVGQAFRDAWNDDGRGQKILETILQIITDIFNFVGELANRFKEAWEANDNGKAIWAAILDIVQKVLDFIHKITSATVEWAKNLDLEPLIEGVRHVLESVSPVIEAIGEAISEIYNGVILPVIGKLLEEWLPGLLEIIASIFSALTENDVILKASFNSVMSVLTSLLDLIGEVWKLIEPIAKFLGGALVVAINAAAFAIGLICDGITLLIDLITSAIEKIREFAQWIGDKVGGWLGLGGEPSIGYNSRSSSMSYGASGYSARSANAFTMEGLSAFKAANNIGTIGDIPHLADGAVISPNSEFLAVLGDQRAGKNIESPLSTIEQAMENVMSRHGDIEGITVNINYTGSLAQFARIIQPEITIAQQRKGQRMTTLGGGSYG